MGGLYGGSKCDSLRHLPSENQPETLLFDPGTHEARVLSAIRKSDLRFPVIIKPDHGERGKGIELVHDEGQLRRSIRTHPTAFIIQEYLDLPFEVGVFYVRRPSQTHGKITSIVIKEFLTVTGDGQQTIEALALKNMRAVLVWEHLKPVLRIDPQRILAKGETVLLEAIGNHNRGTAFNDGCHLINNTIVKETERLASMIPGFYYGRFDLRVASEEDFVNGIGWKVLEVNGANAEPAHIYQQGFPYFKGMYTLLKHWSWACEISRENLKKSPAVKFKECLRVYREWRTVKSTRWT